MPQESKFIPLDGPPPPVQTQGAPPQAGPKFIPLDRIQIAPEWDTEFKKREKQTTARDVGETIGPAIPLALGGLGGLVGGPGGAAVGSGVGSAINTKLMGGSNVDAAKDAALSGGATYVGGKILQPIQGKLASALVAALYNKGVQKATNVATGQPQESLGGDLSDVGKDTGINLALNMVAGKLGSSLSARKGTSAPEPLSNVADEVRGSIVTPGVNAKVPPAAKTTTEYGANAQRSIKGNLSKAASIERKAFDDFRTKHVEPNAVQLTKLVGYEKGIIIDPNTGEAPTVAKTEPVTVNGPIYTLNTQKLAQEALPKIEEFLKGESYQTLPPAFQAKYSKLYATIKDLATPFEAVGSDGKPVQIPIKEWDTVKDVRTDISKLVGGKPTPNFPEANLKKVAESLGQDIDTSVQNFWSKSKGAQDALAVANKATQFKKQIFNKEVTDKLYGKFENGKRDTRTPGDPSEVFTEAYKSPEKAKRLMDAVGPTNLEYVKGDYFDNVLMKKGFGANYSKFKPEAIINDLEDPNSVSRTILSADERNNVLRFARAARSSSEATNGSLSMTERAGKWAVLRLSSGLSRVLVGSSAPANIVIGAKDLMTSLKDSKVSADVASRLIKIRPDSAEAQQASKMLIRSLKGMQVSVNFDGTDHAAFVDENGKLKIAEGSK